MAKMTMIIYAISFAQLFCMQELLASNLLTQLFSQQKQQSTSSPEIITPKDWHESMLQDIYAHNQPSEDTIKSFKNKIDIAKDSGFFFNDVNQKMRYENAGISLLHASVTENKPAYVQALLEAGTDPNIQYINMGRSPLHFAAQGYQHEIMTMLLAHGAYVNIRDANGLTPLFFVESTCKDDKNVPQDRNQLLVCIQILKDAGAEPIDYTKIRTRSYRFSNKDEN